jgi:hypothetical protein
MQRMRNLLLAVMNFGIDDSFAERIIVYIDYVVIF